MMRWRGRQGHIFLELSPFRNSWISIAVFHVLLPGSPENVDLCSVFSCSETLASVFVFLAEDPTN